MPRARRQVRRRLPQQRLPVALPVCWPLPWSFRLLCEVRSHRGQARSPDFHHGLLGRDRPRLGRIQPLCAASLSHWVGPHLLSGFTCRQKELTVRACVFCSATGKLTNEHAWPPRWLATQISRTLPANDPRAFELRRSGALISPHSWRSSSIDNKAKVVCEQCNTTWMNRLQISVASRITDIAFDSGIQRIPYGEQQKLSAWAFMTATVIDNSTPAGEERLVDASVSRCFKSTLDVPVGTQVWIGRYKDDSDTCIGGQHRSVYVPRPAMYSFEKLLVVTVFCGCFVMQLAYPRCRGGVRSTPVFGAPSMKHATVRIWPSGGSSAVWPPPVTLRRESYLQFCVDRWKL